MFDNFLVTILCSSLTLFSEQSHSTLSALKCELNNLLNAKAEFISHRRRLTYYDQKDQASF